MLVANILALSLLTALHATSGICKLLSLPRSRALQLHEKRDVIPLGFTLAGPASPETTLKLRIALVQNNVDGLLNALNDVSTPDGADYGKHLSKTEVEQYVSPKADSLTAVNSWLSANDLNATKLSPAGDWLAIELPVSKANDLFNADFSLFTHESSGVQAIRTMAYSIPASLKGHLNLVYPTTSFPDPSASGSTFVPLKYIKRVESDSSSIPSPLPCGNGTTPACLQALYGIPTTPAVNPSNQLAVTGHFGNIAHYDFLQQFLIDYRPDMNSSTNFTVVSVDDGSNDQSAPSVTEGDLDIQYTVGLATNVPVTYIAVGMNYTDGGLDGYLDMINYLLAQDSPPQVLTTSYGFSESSISQALTNNLCNAYAQLGARGTSILFASGDSGAGCTANSTAFAPTFPSNCPYVTSVGATQGFSPEVAASFSSGGFSNYYSTPSYQKAAVAEYVAQLSGAGTDTRFNVSGRGFPDVSAKGDDFRVWVGSPFASYGTSASSPTFASIIALLNDRLASAGRPPLGFLNPFLYTKGVAALTDIVAGNNTNCNNQGFEATPGWDPVTGLGTPDFAKLLAVVGL
ncbi:Tripeptidyl-peptidase sed3 [Grifola frondosa]|uniref:tripeptidyl-peptidase II n=1 Tax=Grifola frondosa TaxID=5627 RepID=A0A1C7MJT2_GRIFR|nr:Tripeptidyl-peptidase sed3 [Grifola frondosa]